MEMNLTFSGKRRRILQTLLMGLLCCMLTLPARAQDRVTVSGRLVDSGQNPLIGASVIEQGTTNGVTTDVEGRYEISVPGDAVLEYSYIGYKTQDVAVMNRTQIDITMAEDSMMIGEVVAIGYGSQRKEDLSMAVQTVKVDEAARSRASDLGTLLQGRRPAVTRCARRRSRFAAADRRATTTIRRRATVCWSWSTACPTPPTWSRTSRP